MKIKNITIITLGALIGSGQAVTSLIDFAGATPTPVTAQGGNFWTGVDTISTTNLLVTTDGSDSGWDITVGFTGTQQGFGGNGINGDGAAAPFDQSFAIIDGIYSSSPEPTGFVTISLGSLTPNTGYDFIVYTDRATSWSAGNGEINTTTGIGPSGLVTPKDALTAFQITSDGAGNAAFTFAEGPTGNFTGDGVVLNAMSISEAIPEPSTTVLCWVVLTGFLVRRKR
ncbi:MAG: hypothetical protein QNL33_16510 [Akkermansiaceae bacterium]|jgi:hypothetical protein